MNWMIYVICIIDNFLNSKDFFFFYFWWRKNRLWKSRFPEVFWDETKKDGSV